MLSLIPDTVSKAILHTGNMLYTTDVTKQVNMATTEQIVEGLITNLKLDELPSPNGGLLQIKKEIIVNQSDEDKKNLQTMIKVFLNTANPEHLKEALEYTISDLNLPSIDSVILAYQTHPNNENNLLNDLKQLWDVLETFVDKGLIIDIGISDVDIDVFKNLYNCVTKKPRIHQINLSACCVVPPELQEFCKERDIRILTHSDPTDILPSTDLKPLFTSESRNDEKYNDRLSNVEIPWITRLQAHIKCRGILANKGYIVCLKIN